MIMIDLLEDLADSKKTDSEIKLHLDHLHLLIQSDIQVLNLATLNLIDVDLLEEIKRVENTHDSSIYFGKTLCDIKCIIQDEENVREHELFIQYKGLRKMYVSLVNLPYANIEDKEYSSIQEIITAFKKHINELSCYFYELDLIDQQCLVMEPVNPTYKDDYRRILMDGRTWLHVEVTPEGLATNIHLMGQSELWHDKLQEGLLSWDHDKSIISNIKTIFDLAEFPQNTRQLSSESADHRSESLVCSICLCTKLPDIPNVPQPLCQNLTCGVYFHRSCLYEWLVASESRPPVFGVATGSCPSCLQPIACNETDT